MTTTADAPAKEKTGNRGVNHGHCYRCYPEAGPGDVVTAVCGAKKTVIKPALNNVIPPNACVVCLDLEVCPQGHRMDGRN